MLRKLAGTFHLLWTGTGNPYAKCSTAKDPNSSTGTRITSTMMPNENMRKEKSYQKLSELAGIFRIDWFPELGCVYMAFGSWTLMLKVPVMAKSWCCNNRNTITLRVCDKEDPCCIS